MMTHLPIARSATFFLLTAGSLWAQSVVQVPGGDQTAGPCTSYPFGYEFCRYQTLVTAAELGNQPGTITELSLKPCITGTMSFSTMVVRIGHANASTLSSTFADNFADLPTNVFTAANWNTLAHQWVPLGLYQHFSYDGVRDVVIEFEVGRPEFDGHANTRIANTAQPRLVTTQLGSPTGFVDQAGMIMRLHVVSGSVLTYGVGCGGTIGIPPEVGFRGVPSIGETVTLEGTPFHLGAPVILSFGLRPDPQFAIDLTVIGAPGCFLYHDSLATVQTMADGSFSTSVALSIPDNPILIGQSLDLQWLGVDVGATPIGLMVSDGATLTIGD